MDVLIRNLTAETKAALVERARRHERSLHAELLDILKAAAAEPPAALPDQKPLNLIDGRSRGASMWSRDEIYGHER
ncbi:MAG: hypothetical protein LBG11_00100 [Bifidobacteriaceae bacterium]|nr:hypothetical protein [Bifidobacteriaceae bacterium]